MFKNKNQNKNQNMLTGSFKNKGYDWWWHSFTAIKESTGEEVPFFIEYFIINPAKGKDVPVYGQIPGVKQKPSYLMVKAGHWKDGKVQLHRFYGIEEVNFKMGAPYIVDAGECYATEDHIRGKIIVEDSKNHPEWMCDDGSMEWDLKIDKQIAFNVGYGTSWLFRFMKAFEMYWHAEGMKSKYSGTIICNGEKYIVSPETSYGYADKNWGRGFTSPWVWLSSNCMVSNLTGKKLENSVFDIGGGRPKVFFVPLERKLLSAFYYEGKEYEFNFSKLWTFTKTVFDSEETDDEIIWYVKQTTTKAIMETEVHCFKKDMLLVNYEDPNGDKRHTRLWNGGNGTGTVKLYKKDGTLIDDISVSHIGCEYGEYGW